MKRFLLVALLVVAASAFVVAPAFAMDECDHSMTHEPTAAGLAEHVQHAYEMGHITNQGVATALAATLQPAVMAPGSTTVDRQVQALQVFILTVNAQSGKQIDATCAEHLSMQAEHVIMALQGQM